MRLAVPPERIDVASREVQEQEARCTKASGAFYLR
jgi:hypothetical protein